MNITDFFIFFQTWFFTDVEEEEFQKITSKFRRSILHSGDGRIKNNLRFTDTLFSSL